MRKTKRSEKLAEQVTVTLLRVINRIQSRSRAENTYLQTRLTLIEAEICNIISKSESISASQLSTILGVSRSAVSQVAARLRAKGYIREEQDPVNAKRKLLYLTDDGIAASAVLGQYTQEMANAVYDAKYEELEAYLRFVTKLERFHESFLSKRSSPSEESLNEHQQKARSAANLRS